MPSERCKLCRRPMNVPGAPLSNDCGGDCWGCIRNAETDEVDPRPPAEPDRRKRHVSAIQTILAVLALLGAGVGAELGLPLVHASNGVAIATGGVFLLLALLVVRRI